MQLTLDDLATAKEKKMTITGNVGSIEAIFNGSEDVFKIPTIAVIGHPHSLHGGTMNNKVVTTLARTFREVGIPSLRFNFRGVGNTQGEFDGGIGESEDVLTMIQDLSERFPDHQIILAGFSFGAYVTYRAACQADVALLISVAPAVNHGDFCEFDKVPTPWHVMVAESDEIVDSEDILTWHKQVKPAPLLHRFEETSHFFHGKLILLKQKLAEVLSD